MESAPVFQRLHPASLLFSLGSVLRRFLIPGLIVLFLGRGERTEIWAMVLAVPALVYAVAIYLSLRYAFALDGLVIKSGILRRTERHIPYEHIQNVDMTRTVVHRLLGVADVIIQTASGTEAEATLRVLSRAAAEEVRARLFRERRRAVAEVPGGASTTSPQPFARPAPGFSANLTDEPLSGGRILHRVPLGDLVKLGLISNRGLVALAAVLAAATQFDLLPSGEQIESTVGPVSSDFLWNSPAGWLLLALLAAVAVVGLRALSVLWAIATFFGFRLLRDGDELRTSFGLLTQRLLTIPRHRIQLLEIHASLLHRVFDAVTLKARTAGAVRPDAAASSLDALLPIAPREAAYGLLPEIQSELTAPPTDWQGVHPRAVRRAFVVSVLWLAGPLLVLGFAYPPWGSLGGLVLPLAYLFARQRVRHMGYAVTSQSLWYRRGWLSRECRIIRTSKIQAVMIRESPFDRRHEMATLAIDAANAGAVGAAAIRLPYLPREAAARLHDHLFRAAAGTEFRW